MFHFLLTVEERVTLVNKIDNRHVKQGLKGNEKYSFC